ncbi:DJ-1/PfpI family protein [Brevibacterium oceani]|uniref:DJ-1/PfpI family protein n=1 Tax=Brevibacterium oceani TaxID=358099 RepID=UPI0015E74F9E|nr:DJ-1/PfpI family protein [Brevibacterium oceani]
MAPRTERPKALIVLSSAKRLPLTEPADHPGISTGFFLVELAAVMAQFEETHDFILATPDGEVPQLDINGLALNFHAAGDLGPATARHTIQTDAEKLSPERLREKNPELLKRREAELALARRHLGRLPVSEPLPKTDREAVSIRAGVLASFKEVPEERYHSIEQLLAMDRDPSDEFALADFDFVHMPGGHAPMVDFHDNPLMGELLHTLREADVPISLICHAPIALTSGRYRVGADGTVQVSEDHEFKGASITTVPRWGERFMLASQYPKVPGQKTRLTYYVDVALKEAGYDVNLNLNPTAVKVIWDAEHDVLTGNGPQAVDAQAARLVEILGDRATVSRSRTERA